MTRTVNRLTHAEHFKLCQWLQSQPISFEDTCESLASAATLALGFPITKSAVSTGMETLEMEIPAKVPTTTEDKLLRLAGVMIDLFVALDRPIPKELSSLFKK